MVDMPMQKDLVHLDCKTTCCCWQWPQEQNPTCYISYG